MTGNFPLRKFVSIILKPANRHEKNHPAVIGSINYFATAVAGNCLAN
jgi:hypothetical protein